VIRREYLVKDPMTHSFSFYTFKWTIYPHTTVPTLKSYQHQYIWVINIFLAKHFF